MRFKYFTEQNANFLIYNSILWASSSLCAYLEIFIFHKWANCLRETCVRSDVTPEKRRQVKVDLVIKVKRKHKEVSAQKSWNLILYMCVCGLLAIFHSSRTLIFVT